MIRWIVALLLVLLPLEFMWAAVASTCQHERSTSTTSLQHVGHHEHQHKSDSVAGKADVGEKNLDKFDPDRRSGHGFGFAALYLSDAKLLYLRGSQMNAPAPSALAGVSPMHPDRPHWLFLA